MIRGSPLTIANYDFFSRNNRLSVRHNSHGKPEYSIGFLPNNHPNVDSGRELCSSGGNNRLHFLPSLSRK